MPLQIIQTKNAPAPVPGAPYSQGVKATRVKTIVLPAGQLGLTPDGKLVPGGIRAQLQQALANALAIVTEAGLGLQHIVDVMVLLKDKDDWVDMNDVYREFFHESFPARTAFGPGWLPAIEGALVEVKVIAVETEDDESPSGTATYAR